MVWRIILIANTVNAFRSAIDVNSNRGGIPYFRRFQATSSSSSDRRSSKFQLQSADSGDAEDDATTLRSITFSNIREEQEPQLLCNFLMELGACSTSITDSDRGTNDEVAIFDEFDAGSMTRTAVTTHVWNHCGYK